MTLRARVLYLGVCLATSAPGFALVAPPADAPLQADYDSRAEIKNPAGATLQAMPIERAARMLEQRLGVAVTLIVEPVRGVPRSLLPRDPGARLSPPSSDDRVAIARRFLLSVRDLYRLSEAEIASFPLETAFATKDHGWTHVWFQQERDGVKVYGGRIGVNIDRDGQVMNVNAGPFVAGLAAPARPAIPAGMAVILAAEAVAEPIGRGQHLEPIADGDLHAVFERGDFLSPISADLMYFPTRTGARLAWYVVLDSSRYPAWYEQMIDAATGELLYRGNLMQYAQTATAYPIHPEQTPVQQTYDLRGSAHPESPLGWVSTGSTVTVSNNVVAHEDPGPPTNPTCGGQGPIFNDVPPSATQDFVYPIDLLLPPDGYIPGAIANLFVINNFYHDLLHSYGFDEPAGNFQTDNQGLGGLGNDPVEAQAQDKKTCAGNQNNANFGTPADGSPPRMQMYIWTGPDPDRDGDLDADVIIHEYSHGLSNRLVGGPGCVGGCALGSPQSGGMGESWGDMMAASISNEDALGEYSAGDPTGIRNYPFGSSPYTYRDLGQVIGPNACQVHADGQVWSAALWEVRQNFVAYYGLAIGAPKHERYIVDSMKLMAFPPSFLDAKAGMILATGTNDIDRCLMEIAFAKRGMGESASGPGNACPTPTTPPVEDFTPPASCNCVALASPTGLTATASAPNEITVSWPALAGTVFYQVDRADLTTCAASPLFRRLADVAAPQASYVDTTNLQGGFSYTYRVTAVGTFSGSCAAPGVCDDTVASGNCTLPPTFAGVEDAMPGANCSVDVTWGSGTSNCPLASNVTYNVYRSTTLPVPTVTPFRTTTATSFTDTNLSGIPYYYVVHAEDSTTQNPGPANGGNEDQTQVFVGVVPGTRTGTVAQYNFEGASDQGWTQNTVACTGTPTGTWQRADPFGTVENGPASPEDDHTPGPGTTCWTTQNCTAAGCTVGAADIDASTQNLLSPLFDCTGGPSCFVSFRFWYYYRPTPASEDAKFEVSSDGGTNWLLLADVDAIRAAGVATNTWNRFEYDLSTVPGLTLSNQMQLRFSATDCAATIAEAALDDLLIENGQACIGCQPGASTLVPNRLLGTKPGTGRATWILTSVETNGQWNLHTTTDPTQLATLYQSAITATTTTKRIDDPGSYPLGYYQAYGADFCTGVSVP